MTESSAMAADLDDAEENLKDAEYKMVCANLSHDFTETVQYNLRKNKTDSNRHVQKAGPYERDRRTDKCQVLHLRNQLEIGLQQAEAFMQKRLYMACNNSKMSAQNAQAMVRRTAQEAARKFDKVTLDSVHHLGYVDMTKLGRLSAPDIQDLATWCQRTLAFNPDRSISARLCCVMLCDWSVCLGMIFMVAPALAGEGVLNGLRGEWRRVEDKLLSMNMEVKNVCVMFDTSQCHGNRTEP